VCDREWLLGEGGQAAQLVVVVGLC